MAQIVKLTPKDPRLPLEAMDRVAEFAATQYDNAPETVRPMPEPLWRYRIAIGKPVRKVMLAQDAARWLYASLTITKEQKARFDKLVAEAGISDNRVGQLALAAQIERTIVTQPAVLEAVAARFGATIVHSEQEDGEETVLPVDFEARQRAAEDGQVSNLRDWLDERGWEVLMILADECRDTPFADMDDLSTWAQQHWLGSASFGGAPVTGLRERAALDAFFHWLEGQSPDLDRLNRVVANKLR